MLRLAGCLAFVLGALSAVPSRSEAVGDFYRGKTITLIVGYEAGGGYDQYARLFARYAGSYIPGNPNLIVRNMPGAGSLRAANYLYNAAPKDGTVIGTFGQNLPMHQVTGGENVEFDAARFNWIGNFSPEVNVVTAWHTTGVKTIQDVMERELVVGASAPNSTSFLFPTIMNNVLGTKFRIIAGYPGGQSIPLAMERGEVGGRGSESWSALASLRKDWLREGKVRVLVQIGLKRDPELPDVPLMSELAKSDEDRQILEILSSSTMIGRPLVAPPGVPEKIVSALRDAFNATVNDKEFRAEAERADIALDPVSGEDLQAIVLKITQAPKAIIDKAKEVQKPRGAIDSLATQPK